MTAGGSPLGIVIPTLDEEGHLPHLLADLAGSGLLHTVVVADGGSRDATRTIAADAGATVVRAPPGRGPQMNAGAWAVDTPWLLFLHADCRMPGATAETLARWIDEATPATAGYFRFSLQGADRFWRFLEWGQGLRERMYGLPYGDQGLVVHRELFRDVGGFPDEPLMEDVELVRRLRRTGRVERIEAPLPTSPRRYREEGKWRGWIRNVVLISLHLAGIRPSTLARWYPAPNGGQSHRPHRDRDRTGSPRRKLLVFAKAPVAGHVKTRLSADLGAGGAARLYRHMGRRIVQQLAGGAYGIVVCYDPPGSEHEIREWLGAELELRPQSEGDLGRRMESALREALRDCDAACVVGTDAPDVDRRRVEEAFDALEEADVVFGPARDGGYYLVGMREVTPALFRDLPWSAPGLLARTLERAGAAGLRAALLPPLADVDTPADVTPRLLEQAGID